MSPVKRIRRTPEEARRVILDAAEAVMARTGPGGLRLQEVAEAAGVSHPTILHHFENREGLMQALNARTLADLGAVLTAQMDSPNGSSTDAVRAAFAAYRGGFAQRIAWMIQGEAPAPGQVSGSLLNAMTERLHAIRCAHAPPGQAPPRADSEAIVHLITVAGFGDALIGPRMRRLGGAAEEDAARVRFEDWLGGLIQAHILGFRAG